MSSNIRVKRKCDYCKEEFEAKTLHTRYCSHSCNRRHYKQVKREEKLFSYKEEFTDPEENGNDQKKIGSENLKVTGIREKDYLSISESAIYLGVSKRTIERNIASGKLQVVRLGNRVIVPKESISKLLGV
ncbi:excisionase family DNA-binding protein [Aquiflexum gelatinilyticum]|uniref:excisionase family DNA-binding protein n=1 Tax=Aquiflexum gelatinilyticum TaxID=2961943 RepID=UPI0021693D0A|nr:excisionase family DNA-binding protein [Aquiflexum gelatinilyticum]MCS4432834.1 excisionase family DNA-binding protein [Aquiflexum gelatinilyticum]